jgi:DNA-binding transcriptional MerR regulator
MRKMLRIGELAELAGTTPNAVRFYHEAGLLREPRRSESGYRLYDDADLIKLGCVLRLRSLRLSIPQVRDILANPTEEEVLKRALESRFEELSAEMVELEAAKERIADALRADGVERLLDGSPHVNVSLPGELEELSEELVDKKGSKLPRLYEYERKLGAVLGAFRWPTRYVSLLRDVLHNEMLDELDPETERRTEEFAECWVALHDLPEDDPEVERLVEDYLRYERDHPFPEEGLNDWWEQVLRRNHIPVGDPILKMVVKLVERSFSPAQKRFRELLRTRKREIHGPEASGFTAKTLKEWLGRRSTGCGGEVKSGDEQ